MSKVIRNTLSTDIFITDIGVNLTAGDSYLIEPIHYLIWAGSADVDSHIIDGSLEISTFGRKLLYQDALELLHYERAGWSTWGAKTLLDVVPDGRTLYIDTDRQYLVMDEIEATGNIEINGTLGVI